MPVVHVRGPLKQLAGDRGEHVLEGDSVGAAAARARARASVDERLDPRRARRPAPAHQRVRQRRARRSRTPLSRPAIGSTCFQRSREVSHHDDGAARRDEEGPVRAWRASRAAPFEVRSPRVRRRVRRVRDARPALRPRARVGDLRVLRPEALVRRRPDGRDWEQADGLALPEGGEQALERIWVIVPGEADGVVYAGGDPGVLFESRDGGATFTLNRGLWEHPSRRRWQPGGGGLCLHSIVDVAGRSGPPRGGDLGRRRVAHRGRRRDLAQRQRGASSPRYLPEDVPRGRGRVLRALPRARADTAGADVHAVPRRRVPLRRRRPDVDRHRRPACRRTSGSRSRSIPPTPTAPTSSRSRPTSTASRPDGRVRVYETRDAGADLDRARPTACRRPRRLSHGPARGLRLDRPRRRRWSCTSARRRERCSARATRARPGSRSPRTCRRSCRSRPAGSRAKDVIATARAAIPLPAAAVEAAAQTARGAPAAAGGDERQLDGDRRADAVRRVDLEAPVERSRRGRAGRTDRCPPGRRRRRRRRGPRREGAPSSSARQTDASLACAYFATLVSASAVT